MDANQYIVEVNKATQLINEGKIDEAIAICEPLKKAMPDRMGAYLMLAQVFIKKEDHEQAALQLLEGVKYCDEVLLKINLSIVLSRLNKYDEAQVWFEKAEQSSSDIRNPKFWFHYA